MAVEVDLAQLEEDLVLEDASATSYGECQMHKPYKPIFMIMRGGIVYVRCAHTKDENNGPHVFEL